MNEKTIEILIQLLGHIKDHNLDMESLNEFSEHLVTRGYSENDVSEALGWLFDRLSVLAGKSSGVLDQKTESVRVLHDFERMKISPDMFGYLLKLRSTGVVTAAQMERVIEYCLLFGPAPASEADINEIVASILFEGR